MILNYQVELCFISFIVFVIMLLISKPWITFNSPKKQNTNKGVFVFFVIFTFFNIFQFWARDYYAYYLGFKNNHQYINGITEEYELVYNWLADVLNNNYILWRTIIWGVASVFTYYTAKILDVRNRNLLVLMTLVTAINNIDNVSRGVLGHTMLLLGVVLFLDKRSKVVEIIGVCLFCLSYFFHKSMYVNIIFAILSFFPFNKKMIIFLILLFPFLVPLVSYFINAVSTGELIISLGDSVGGVGDRSAIYASQEAMKYNTNGLIRNIISLIPEYLCLFYIIKKVFFENCFSNVENRKVYLYLARLSFVCFYTATLFAFVETSSWIYIRFKSLGFFPLIFVLAKVWSFMKKSDFYIKVIVVFFLIDLFFLYFYQLFINNEIYI